MTTTLKTCASSKSRHGHRVHAFPVDLYAEARLGRHADEAVGPQLDLVQHPGSISSHRHRELEVLAVRYGTHDLKIRRLRERALTTEGDPIDLWPANRLRVQSVQGIDVGAMYPPEKPRKAANVQQAA